MVPPLSTFSKSEVRSGKYEVLFASYLGLCPSYFSTVDLNDLSVGIVSVELRSSVLPKENNVVCVSQGEWGLAKIPVEANHDIVGALKINSRMCTGRNA